MEAYGSCGNGQVRSDDNEGKMLTVKYPDTWVYQTDGSLGAWT